MKLERLILFLLFLLVLAAGVIYNEADRDLWHRLAMGRLTLENGSIPLCDPFAYTETRIEWIDHEWGSGLLFWITCKKFGDIGLILLKDILFFSTLILICRFRSIFLSLLLFFALLPGFVPTVRCQIFTYFFFALWLRLLDASSATLDSKKIFSKLQLKILAVFPLTTILWVNLHGGFVAGFGLIVLHAVDSMLRGKRTWFHLSAILVSIPFTLINPYGLKFWFYILEAATMQRPLITEWQSIRLFELNFNWLAIKIILILLISIIVILVRRKCFRNLHGIVILAATLFLGIKHARHITFFAIAAMYYIIPALECFNSEWTGKIFERTLRFFNIALLALVFSASIYILADSEWKIKVPNGLYPVKASEFIYENGIEGNILVPLNWGSYVLWKLYPSCRVSLDGRYEEVYTNETYRLVTDFAFGLPKWKECLEKFNHDIILLPADSPTNNLIHGLNSWKEVYRDETAVVYLKRDAEISGMKKNFSKNYFSSIEGYKRSIE